MAESQDKPERIVGAYSSPKAAENRRIREAALANRQKGVDGKRGYKGKHEKKGK